MCQENNLKNLNWPQQWGQPQKQRGLAHWWKAYSAGHIPLCDIFCLVVDVIVVDKVAFNLIVVVIIFQISLTTKIFDKE